MTKYHYSIIIPHKNTQDLLQRCLDSIPHRNDIETIIIDDNSDPKIVDFSHFPGQDRQNMTIIFDKSNMGAGRARNIGLEKASGEWVIFADADDYFYDNTFEIMDKKIQKGTDIYYFHCDSRDGETGELIEDRMPSIKKAIETSNYNYLRYGSCVPWGKVIHRLLIEKNHIRFDEVICANDMMFSLLVGYYANTFKCFPDTLYCCTRNKNSLFFDNNISKIITRVKVLQKTNKFLYLHGLKEQQKINLNFVFFFFPKHPLLFCWAFLKCMPKGLLRPYLSIFRRRFASELKKLF